jgi:hypothetical protein
MRADRRRHFGQEVVDRQPVEFWLDGERIRTHKATHDPNKLYGAFATPGGCPRKKEAAS